MKPVSWLSLFLILAFVLAGCAPVGSTMQPTQAKQLPSPTSLTATVTGVPSSTRMPTATDMLAPTATQMLAYTKTFSPNVMLTPVDTLEPERITETMQPLLRDPLNCAVPCFWGITPGKTNMDEVRIFFSRLGFTPFEGTLPSGRDFYTITYESSIDRQSSVTFLPSNNLVKDIEITPDIVKQKEGSPREWIAYSPETLIKQFGQPSRVQFALDWGPNFVIVMIMYFDNHDLIAFYSGYNMIPGRPRSPRLCPMTATFDGVRLWIGPTPADPPTFPTVSLMKATSLSLDHFTQLMLGDPKQACFIVNGNVFQ